MADLSTLLGGSSYRPRSTSPAPSPFQRSAPAPLQRPAAQRPAYLDQARSSLTGGVTPEIKALRDRLRAIATEQLGAAPPSDQIEPARELPSFGASSSSGAPSLLGQANRMLKGIPQAVSGLVKTGAISAAAGPRLLGEVAAGAIPGVEAPYERALAESGSNFTAQTVELDPNLATPKLQEYYDRAPDVRPGLMGEGGFADKYIPLVSGMARSMETTTGVLTDAVQGDFSAYKEASDEGRILERVFEDIGNVGMVGGIAAKGLGTVSQTVSATPNAARALGARPGRALSAGAASPLDDFVGRVSPLSKTPVSELSVKSTGALEPLAQSVTIPGTGLAGYLERSGYGQAAATTSKVATGVHRASRLGEAVDDAQFSLVPRLVGKAAVKAGQPVVSKFGSFAQRYSGENPGSPLAEALRPFGTENRKVRRQVHSLETRLGRETTAQERAYINALVVADEANLTVPQRRASTFEIDDRFVPIAKRIGKLRAEGLDRIVAGDVIERAYADVPSEMRPSIDDIEVYLDWKAGRLDDVQTTAMNQVGQLVTAGSDRLTHQFLSAKKLDPAQLDAEMLPDAVEAVRAKIEKRRETAITERDKVTAAAAHARRRADAHAAVNSELPPPPDPKVLVGEGEAAGRFIAEAQGLRREHQIRTSEVSAALERYERAVRDGDSIVDRLAGELDRKVEAADRLATDIGRLERRLDAVDSPLAGIVETTREGLPTSPEPPPVDISDLPPVVALKAAVDEIRAPERVSALRHVERFVGTVSETQRKNKKTGKPIGGMVPDLAGSDVPQLPAEWTSGVKQSTGRIKQYIADGFIGSKKGRHASGRTGHGVPLDVWTDQVNASLGKNWSPEQALEEYFAAIDNYYDARSVTSDTAILEAAEAAGLSTDAVKAAIEGGAAEFKRVVLAERVEALSDVREAFADMEPSVRESIVAELDRMREAGASNDDIGSFMYDILEDAGPGARLLAPVWDSVPMADIAEFVAAKDVPMSIIDRVVEKPGVLQKQQVAKLQQKILDSRAVLRSTFSDQRSLRDVLDKTSNQLKRREAQAGSALDRAANVADQVGELADEYAGDVDAVKAQAKAATDAGPWKRTAGSKPVLDADGQPVIGDDGKVVRERTNPPSPAERAIERQGRLDQAARAKETAKNRVDRKIEKHNEKITDLPDELTRSVQERLRDDVNRPAVRTVQSTFRSLEKRLGGVEKVGDTWQLSNGVMGDIARKYGVHDEVLAGYFHEKRMVGGAPLEPVVVRDMLEQVIEDSGVSHIVDVDGVPTRRPGLSPADRARLGRSWQADQMLREIDDVVAANNDANMPFRVFDLVREIATDPAFDQLPSDMLSRVDAQWNRYLGKRGRFLTKTMDDQAAVMPGRFRAVAANSRMALRGLLDEAEALTQAGDSASAQLLLKAAEDIPTTLKAMVDSGIDPTYLTGGQAPTLAPAFGGSGGITSRALRAEHLLESGLRPVDLDGVVRLQMHQAGQFLVNNAADYIETNMGVPASSVIGDAQAAWDKAHPFDGGVMPERDMRAALADAGFQAADSTAPVGMATQVIPVAIARQLAKMRQEPGAVWRAMNKGNQIFKTSVLPLSPRWLSGNVVGNAFMAMFNYGMSPLELARLVDDIQKLEGGWKQLRKQGGLAKFAPDELASHGLTYNEHQLRWGTKDELLAAFDGETPSRWQTAKNRGGDFVAASYNLNEFVDNLGRSAVFLKELRKHGDEAISTKAALNAMGDFTRMTPFERKWVRQVLPFYSWLRHQTVAAMRLPLQSPYRAAFLLHLSDMMNDPEMGPEMLQQLGSKMSVGGQMWNLGGLSPFADPTELGLDPTNPEMTRSVTPTIKFPFEAITGRQLGGGPLSRPFEDRPTDTFGRETSQSPFRRILSDPAAGVGEIGFLAAGQLPQSRALRDVALGPGKSRYQSGDRRPTDQYDRDVSVIDTLLRGAALPNRNDNVDIQQMLRDQAKREAEARRRQMSGR